MDHKLIRRAAKDILDSKKTIAFTGAGISVEAPAGLQSVPLGNLAMISCGDHFASRI